MGKKPPSKLSVPTSETAKLTHSPFAALGGGGVKAPTDVVADPAPQPSEPPAASPPAGRHDKPQGRLILRRETKHRGGKPVIVVSGFAASGVGHEELAALASELKSALACGGTLERSSNGSEHELVLQCKQPAKLAALLADRGFRVAGVTS